MSKNGGIYGKSSQGKIPVYLQIAFQMWQKLSKNNKNYWKKMPSIRKLTKKIDEI